MFIYLGIVIKEEDEHYERGRSRKGISASDDTAPTRRSSETSVTLFM